MQMGIGTCPKMLFWPWTVFGGHTTAMDVEPPAATYGDIRQFWRADTCWSKKFLIAWKFVKKVLGKKWKKKKESFARIYLLFNDHRRRACASWSLTSKQRIDCWYCNQTKHIKDLHSHFSNCIQVTYNWLGQCFLKSLRSQVKGVYSLQKARLFSLNTFK